jgi:hypothetical protein
LKQPRKGTPVITFTPAVMKVRLDVDPSLLSLYQILFFRLKTVNKYFNRRKVLGLACQLHFYKSFFCFFKKKMKFFFFEKNENSLEKYGCQIIGSILKLIRLNKSDDIEVAETALQPLVLVNWADLTGTLVGLVNNFMGRHVSHQPDRDTIYGWHGTLSTTTRTECKRGYDYEAGGRTAHGAVLRISEASAVSLVLGGVN